MFKANAERITEENSRWVTTLYEFAGAIGYRNSAHVEAVERAVFGDIVQNLPSQAIRNLLVNQQSLRRASKAIFDKAFSILEERQVLTTDLALGQGVLNLALEAGYLPSEDILKKSLLAFEVEYVNHAKAGKLQAEPSPRTQGLEKREFSVGVGMLARNVQTAVAYWLEKKPEITDAHVSALLAAHPVQTAHNISFLVAKPEDSIDDLFLIRFLNAVLMLNSVPTRPNSSTLSSL